MNALSCKRIGSMGRLFLLGVFLGVVASSCDNSTGSGENPGPLPEYETVDCQPAWSPTSEWIAFQRRGEETEDLKVIFLIRPDGSGAERMIDLGFEPDWSPEGDRIIYSDGWDGVSTRVHDLGTDSTWVLFPGGLVFSLDWSPVGWKVAGVNSADGTPDICVSSLETLQCRWFGSGGEADWSPDGSELLCLWNGMSIMDSSGANRRQIISYESGEAPVLGAHWHPDGDRIVFCRLDVQTWDYKIWLVNADGTGLQCLGIGGGPAWSPDGEQIVFADDVPEGEWRSVRLWIMNADGTERRQLTFPDTTQLRAQ